MHIADSLFTRMPETSTAHRASAMARANSPQAADSYSLRPPQPVVPGTEFRAILTQPLSLPPRHSYSGGAPPHFFCLRRQVLDGNYIDLALLLLPSLHQPPVDRDLNDLEGCPYSVTSHPSIPCSIIPGILRMLSTLQTHPLFAVSVTRD